MRLEYTSLISVKHRNRSASRFAILNPIRENNIPSFRYPNRSRFWRTPKPADVILL